MNAPANIAVPNLAMTRDFIRPLAGDADTPLCVRFIHDQNRHADKAHGTIAELWPQVELYQRLGYGAFVVVNAGGDKDADIIHIRAAFVDGDNIPLPEHWHVEPDLIVRREETHWHAYWNVADDFPVEQFETLQRRLAAHYKTDPKVCNLSRVMRLPGTLHQKGETPILVTFEDRTAGIRSDYSFDQLVVGLPEVRAVTRTPDDDQDEAVEWDQPQNVERMEKHLRQLVKNGDVAIEGQQGNNRTYEIACEIIAGGVSPAMTFDLMRRIWNPECVPPWSEDELATIVANAATYRQDKGAPNAVAPGSETFAQIAALQPDAPAPTERDASIAPPAEMLTGAVVMSDAALSDYFADCHDHHLRFDVNQMCWRAFDGSVWIEVATPLVWNLIKPHHLELARYCSELKAADRKALCSRSTIAAVEGLSRGHRKFAIKQAAWDADPWMLNTPGGIVDLRTRKLRPTKPDDYCTKSTAVAPDFDADCPLWRKFLHRTTAGNVELQTYLQRWAGYCLTGETREHKMLFGYGTGGNGKGVFCNTLTRIWGDYAQAAPVDMFTQSNHDRHTSEVARLPGARLVVAQETDQGRRWAEAKIKALTGGDIMSARKLYGHPFDFTPQFKLVIAGNHKPRLENVDEAIRRRLHLVPFTVTIPDSERDPELSEKLKDEWAAILAWAIAGCLEWQRAGLSAPSAVKDATREYFEDQDPLAGWIEERCVPDLDAWTPVADLFRDYEMFLLRQRVERESLRRFSERLESHGFKRSKKGKDGIRGFSGIVLREPAEQCDEVPT